MYVCMYAYLCLCIKVKRTRASWENTPLEAQTILRQKHTQKQPHVTEHKNVTSSTQTVKLRHARGIHSFFFFTDGQSAVVRTLSHVLPGSHAPEDETLTLWDQL